MTSPSADDIREHVRRSYGNRVRPVLESADTIEVVSSGDACCDDTCCTPAAAEPVEVVAGADACCDTSAGDACCGSESGEAAISNIAKLYQDTDISDLGSTVTDVAFGCGNPTAISALERGQVVLDLGSGGGIDCFLAAKMVGETGRVYGVDMTPEMVTLARRNAEKVGATNVEFRLGEIEHLPIADASIDVVISNCVINLSPDKDQVFAEAFRVLRPGGRLQVSDIVWTQPPPGDVRGDMEQWAGCTAGAMLERDYIAAIERAGFTRVTSQAAEYPGRNGLASAGVVAYKEG